MIKYNLTIKTIHDMRKDNFFFQTKFYFIFAIIAFALCIFYFTIAFLISSKAFEAGYILLLALILDSIMIIVTNARFKRNYDYYFNMNNVDGVIEYQIDLQDGVYRITNLTNETKSKFEKDNIKKITVLKHSIFIKFKIGSFYSLPKTEEICELFQIKINKKD